MTEPDENFNDDFDDDFIAQGQSSEKTFDISPDAVLSMVQQRRLNLLFTGQPLDKVENKLLDDTVKTALTQMRIASDEGTGESVADLARVLGTMLSDRQTNLKVLNPSPGTTNIPDGKLLDLGTHDFSDDELVADSSDIDIDEVLKADFLK